MWTINMWQFSKLVLIYFSTSGSEEEEMIISCVWHANVRNECTVIFHVIILTFCLIIMTQNSKRDRSWSDHCPWGLWVPTYIPPSSHSGERTLPTTTESQVQEIANLARWMEPLRPSSETSWDCFSCKGIASIVHLFAYAIDPFALN